MTSARNPALVTGGLLSVAASLLHIGCIIGGPDWYRFFGAGEPSDKIGCVRAFRLQNGVHQFTLAKNMGTSVAMLEQYYGHTSNVTSADELTKRVRKTTAGTKSTLSWLDD